jgi:hypothetical protein
MSAAAAVFYAAPVTAMGRPIPWKTFPALKKNVLLMSFTGFNAIRPNHGG